MESISSCASSKPNRMHLIGYLILTSAFIIYFPTASASPCKGEHECISFCLQMNTTQVKHGRCIKINSQLNESCCCYRKFAQICCQTQGPKGHCFLSSIPMRTRNIGGVPAVCSKGRVKRVVIIGIDGAGSFHSEQVTPNIISFLRSGSYCNLGTAQVPTNSSENWGSILTGVNPRKHGVTNMNINQGYPDDSNYPTLFKLIHEMRPYIHLASLVSWEPINIGLIEPSAPVFKFNAEDPAVVNYIVKHLFNKNPCRPQFVFIQLSDVDAAGHNYGWGSEEFFKQYANTDVQVGQILDTIAVYGLTSSTLVMLTADHGGVGMGHGGTSFNETHVLWGVAGPGVRRQEFRQDSVASMDLPAIALHALKIRVPPNYDGKVVPIFKV